MLGRTGAPRRSSPVDQTAIAVPSKAEAVTIFIQSPVSFVTSVIATAYVLTGFAPHVLSVSTAPVFVDVNLSVFKVISLLAMRLLVIRLLVFRNVLLSQLAVHSRQPFACYFNFTDWPDGGQKVPKSRLAKHQISEGSFILPELWHEVVELLARNAGILQTSQVVADLAQFSTHDLRSLFGRRNIVTCRVHDATEVATDRLQ